MNREDKICLVAIVVIIALLASALTYNWHLTNEAALSDKEKRDDLGFGESYTSSSDKKHVADSMKIHFTASYTNGTIFETTRADLATQAGVKRSAFFEGPPDKDKDGIPDDEPLKVEVGVANDLPDALNDQFIGLKEGDTETFTLSPDEAFGGDSGDLVRVIPLTEEVDVYQKVKKTEFEDLYPDQFMELGVSFTHRFWGWKVTIVDIDAQNVTLRNEPETPFTVTTLPWEVTADNIYTDLNVIHVTHHPTDENLGKFVKLGVLELYDLAAFEDIPDTKRELGQMKYSNTDGLVTSINDGIVIDFNREMNGEWIVYEVEVLELKITKL